MSVDENRTCECNSDSNLDNIDDIDNIVNYNIRDNIQENDRTINYENRREMIDKIRALDFSINELALYLDTHPDDQKALCLHRRYCKECKDLKDKYQKIYGPLTINYPCNKWRWLEEPWPWERGNF